nr:MAG TPA: hypothetical protein [Caudoviricetes sp.]
MKPFIILSPPFSTIYYNRLIPTCQWVNEIFIPT